MMCREMLGPTTTRTEEIEIVHALRRIVGLEPTEVHVMAIRSRVAADKVLRQFHIPLVHRLMIWQ